jgi:hydroxymethylpyrimidine pyrophosphatase-like HAD family hydrolase
LSFFSTVEAVFTDLDGTLTQGGRVRPSTYAAMGALDAAGVPVVVVTGRPAGWVESIIRMWPVRAAVAENGGVIFLPRGSGAPRKLYGVPRSTLAGVRRRMLAAAREACRQVPGARLAADSPYTEVNLALDWNEDVRLPEASARRIEALLRRRGYNAVRSSVHVNFWPGRFDKLSACRRVVRALGGDPRALEPYLYVGDALNDEPMFRGFPRSIGVANVRDVWDELASKPARVTRRPEGAGFEEVARAVLRARR